MSLVYNLSCLDLDQNSIKVSIPLTDSALVDYPANISTAISERKVNVNPYQATFNNLTDLFRTSNTLNDECYILDKQVVKHTDKPNEVFSSSIHNSSAQHWIYPKERTSNYSSDFLIIPGIIGMLLFVAILIRYAKYLTKFFESLIYAYVVEKFISDINVPTKRLLLLLDFLSLITLSFLGIQFLSILGVSLDGKWGALLMLGIVFAGLLTYRIYSFIIHKVTESLIYKKNFTSNLYFDSLIAIRSAGILLFPLSFIIFYVNKPIDEYFLYAAISAFGLLFIYRLFRIISLFIKNSISLLYFILYLCALEIVPIIVLYVQVQRM